MKTIKYKYDEGYGCGEREYEMSGITIDEIILQLSTWSKKGYGDAFLFDFESSTTPMDSIRLNYNEYLDKDTLCIE